MNSIAIQQLPTTDNIPAKVESIFNRIRERAYSLFEQRGRESGHELDDWLKAEREMLWSPPVDLSETKDEFRASIRVPGIDAKNIEVSASPETLVVSGKNAVDSQETSLFCRIDLPAAIDMNTAKATLDEDVLRLTAGKAPQSKSRVATA